VEATLGPRSLGTNRLHLCNAVRAQILCPVFELKDLCVFQQVAGGFDINVGIRPDALAQRGVVVGNHSHTLPPDATIGAAFATLSDVPHLRNPDGVGTRTSAMDGPVGAAYPSALRTVSNSNLNIRPLASLARIGILPARVL
jgi:hypothetical protein